MSDELDEWLDRLIYGTSYTLKRPGQPDERIDPRTVQYRPGGSIIVQPTEELISAWCPVEFNVTTWRRTWYAETSGSSAVRRDVCATCGAVRENLG